MVLGTVANYEILARDLPLSLTRVAAQPDVKRDTDYFLANIRNVKSADEFIRDDRLFAYAMTAFGLKDMIYGKAFMRKVLAEGLDGEHSFAMQLADGRFREFAEAFNFARYGATATAFDRAQQGTVDRFLRVRLEADAGTRDEGVRLALYFQRKATGVTSVYGLMGDAALYKVVQTALGLPAALSAADIDKQAAVITAKFRIEDLQDPDKLQDFITRFTARWQAANAQQAPVPQVALAQPLLTSFDNSLLLKMQTMRPGR